MYVLQVKKYIIESPKFTVHTHPNTPTHPHTPLPVVTSIIHSINCSKNKFSEYVIIVIHRIVLQTAFRGYSNEKS